MSEAISIIVLKTKINCNKKSITTSIMRRIALILSETELLLLWMCGITHICITECTMLMLIKWHSTQIIKLKLSERKLSTNNVPRIIRSAFQSHCFRISIRISTVLTKVLKIFIRNDSCRSSSEMKWEIQYSVKGHFHLLNVHIYYLFSN